MELGVRDQDTIGTRKACLPAGRGSILKSYNNIQPTSGLVLHFVHFPRFRKLHRGLFTFNHFVVSTVFQQALH